MLIGAVLTLLLASFAVGCGHSVVDSADFTSPEYDLPASTRADESTELDALSGTWEITRVQLEDGSVNSRSNGVRWMFDRNEVTLVGTDGSTGQRTFELDAESNPKRLDFLTLEDGKITNRHLMIYLIDGDKLTVSHFDDTSIRPTSFESDAIILEFRRVP